MSAKRVRRVSDSDAAADDSAAEANGDAELRRSGGDAAHGDDDDGDFVADERPDAVGDDDDDDEAAESQAEAEADAREARLMRRSVRDAADAAGAGRASTQPVARRGGGRFVMEPLEPDDELSEDELLGRVHSLRLVNFMCHHHMFVKFGRRVNLLHGQNGSGKSAIFTAIMVALGAPAKRFKRVRSLADFVMKGKKTAEITIQLYNTGDCAHEPERFGHYLTIRRSLGAGERYQIVDDLSFRTLPRHELRMILDKLNVHVNNPCVLMTQEDTRSFAGESKPRDRFNFFNEALLISRVLAELGRIQESLDDIKKAHEAKKRELDLGKKLLEEAHRRMKSARDSRNLERRIDLAKGERMWAEIGVLRAQFDGKTAVVAELDVKLQGDVAKMTQLNSDLEAARAVQLGLQQEVTKAESEMHRLRQEQRRNDSQTAQLEAAIVRLEADLARIDGSIEGHRLAIQQLQHHLKPDVQRKVQEASDALAAATEKLAEQKARVDGLRRSQRDSEAAQRAAQDDANMARQTLRRAQSDLESQQRRETSLSGASEDSLNLYGPEMPRIVRLLRDNANRFSRPVEGPIASLIDVEPSCEVAFEAILKRLASSFVTASPQDSRAAMKLLADNRLMQSSIRFVSPASASNPYNLGARPPNSFLDYFRFKDDVTQRGGDVMVMNALVDQLNIDLHVVLQQPRDVFNEENRRREFRHRLHGIDKDGTLYEHRGRDSGEFTQPFFRGKAWFAKASDRVSELSRVRDSIANTRALIPRLEADVRAKDAEVARVSAQAAQYDTTELQDALRDLHACEQEHDKCRARSDELVAKEGSEITRQINREQAQIAAKLEQRSQKQTEMQAAENRLNELRDRMDGSAGLESMGGLGELKEKLSTAVTEAATLSVKAKRVQDRLQEKRAERAAAKEAAEAARIALREVENQLAAERARRKEQYEAACLTAAGSAAGDGAPAEQAADLAQYLLETPPAQLRRARVIDDDIRQLEAQRERLLNDLGFSPDEAMRMFVEARDNVRQLARQELQMKDSIHKLTRSIEVRSIKLVKLRRTAEVRASQVFQDVFSQRAGRHGTLRFVHHDDDTGELFVSVSVGRGINDAETTLAGLSGGERSFVTVSLLNALWETAEPPFCGADEFDVYLDDTNRRASLQSMLVISLERKRQYFFLTPLDISSVPKDKNVRPIVLTPPERIIDASARALAAAAAADDDSD